MIKIVCISDTHMQLSKVKIPKGDILIHAGDLTYRGDFEELSQELDELALHRSKFKHIVIVPGNHDWMAERDPDLMEQMCQARGIILLNHESMQIEGLKFFGSGYTPEFCKWALNVPRGEPLRQKWAMIPDDTDVLITHGPPKDILDLVPRPKGFRAGCQDLYNRIQQLSNLKLHVFGHLHMNHAVVKLGNIFFVNAAICTESYDPDYKAIVVKLLNARTSKSA